MLVAEQATQSRYWVSSSGPTREIMLTARLEVPGEAGVDVETSLLFEPLASTWDDQIDRSLYDGVHAGLAIVGLPLPADGLRILITELRITPPLAAGLGTDEMHSVAETVRALAAASVSTLWTGLHQATTASTA